MCRWTARWRKQRRRRRGPLLGANCPSAPMEYLRDFEKAHHESSCMVVLQRNGHFEEEAEEADDAPLLLGACFADAQPQGL